MTRSQRPSKQPSRRRVLQVLAASTTGSLAGCSFFEYDTPTTETPRTERPIGRTPARGREKRRVPSDLKAAYENSANVVQLGADHTGQQSVTAALQGAVGDDTALYLPRGEYRMDEPLELAAFENLALVGDGALVRPSQGYDATLFDLGDGQRASGLRFTGIDFDFRAQYTGARPVGAAVTDDLVVADVTVYGRQDVDRDCMRFDVTSPSGTGLVRNLNLPDGGTTAFPITGIYVGEQHTGTLTFSECAVSGFPDNGLYASPARGRVNVVGGRYANNGIASVRVSGPSRIEGVRVVCDTTRSELENLRGIRLREGSNVVVTDSTVEMRQVPESDGAVTMAEWLETATIQRTQIRTDADGVPAIRAKRPRPRARRTRRGETSVTVRDVAIAGGAASDEAILVDSRGDCTFEDLCIQQGGPNRDGIVVRNSRGAVLDRSTIDVTGDPLVLDNATLRRRSFRTASFGSGCFE